MYSGWRHWNVHQYLKHLLSLMYTCGSFHSELHPGSHLQRWRDSTQSYRHLILQYREVGIVACGSCRIVLYCMRACLPNREISRFHHTASNSPGNTATYSYVCMYVLYVGGWCCMRNCKAWFLVETQTASETMSQYRIQFTAWCSQIGWIAMTEQACLNTEHTGTAHQKQTQCKLTLHYITW